MPCIGIITGHPKKPKKQIFGRYTKEVILNEKNPFRLIVVKVPFCEEELMQMTPKCAKRILKKARKILERLHCKDIVLSYAFENVSKDEQSDVAEKRRDIFMSVAHLCVRRVAVACGINLMESKVCIRDSKSDTISEILMEKLCFDTKNLVLCTRNLERGRKICEEFFDNRGMAVALTEDMNDNRADIVIDADQGQIRFGRIVTIDGVMPDFDLGGAEVDALKVAAHLKDFDITNRNLSYFSGKKKLTL